MGVRTEETSTEMTVWLSGELDHHAARVMREQIDSAIARSTVKTVRLDFSGVGFMDSSGIGLIMGRYRLMLSRGGRLLVVGASERLKRVMKLAGLERLPVWEEPSANERKRGAYKR